MSIGLLVSNLLPKNQIFWELSKRGLLKWSLTEFPKNLILCCDFRLAAKHLYITHTGNTHLDPTTLNHGFLPSALHRRNGTGAAARGPKAPRNYHRILEAQWLKYAPSQQPNQQHCSGTRDTTQTPYTKTGKPKNHV